ncbi:sporulation protein YtxC [Alkalibacillus silvisoli]|uniref:Sporulation protein YtxC n=1 Tax=Alkalibacillus silvisoli TaxID=392823 RepID=A0ABP3JK90_9BACI
MKETSLVFKNEYEAKQFYLYLMTVNFKGNVHAYENTVWLSNNLFVKRTSLVDLIFPYILDTYVPRISQKILREAYYFDDDEIEQIIPFVVSLSTAPKMLHSELNDSLYERLVHYIFNQENTTSLEMEHLYEQLFSQEGDWYEIVGFGIEEWQGELHFQDRMEQLRSFIDGQEPYYEHVIVYYKQDAILFEGNGKLIQDQILSSATTPFQEIMDQTKVIGKLLAIAPNRVDVYASNDRIHEIYSLMNIFQERVCLYPINQFPHYFEMNNKRQ